MHIGIDIDGVLSTTDYTHISRRAVVLLLWIVSRISPERVKQAVLDQNPHKEIDIARKIASEHTVSIITARPISIKQYTEQWLQEVARIQYDQIFFVGLNAKFAARKLAIAKENKIDLFLDDTQATVDLFLRNGVNAHYFQSWQEVENIITDMMNNTDQL